MVDTSKEGASGMDKSFEGGMVASGARPNETTLVNEAPINDEACDLVADVLAAIERMSLVVEQVENGWIIGEDDLKWLATTNRAMVDLIRSMAAE
jgi:hypothetical protein